MWKIPSLPLTYARHWLPLFSYLFNNSEVVVYYSKRDLNPQGEGPKPAVFTISPLLPKVVKMCIFNLIGKVTDFGSG